MVTLIREWLKSEDLKKQFKSQYWVTIQEAELLASRVDASGVDCYLESGTCHGYSTCWVATTGIKSIYTFDPANRVKVWDQLHGMDEKIHFCQGKFQDELEGVLQALPDALKFYYFIDGDHTTKGVTSDFNAVLPWLDTMDRIMFHDTRNGNIGRFMDRIWKRFPSWIREDFSTDRGMTEFTVA
jgi:hypothetical protein